MHGYCGNRELHCFGRANVPRKVRQSSAHSNKKLKRGKKLTVLTFYRVIGAIIVVAGLYLVVWGKSKDYASSSTSIDEKIPSAAEQVAADSNIEESSDHEAIIIDMCDQEIVTRK